MTKINDLKLIKSILPVAEGRCENCKKIIAQRVPIPIIQDGIAKVQIHYNFCPFCGAELDKEKNYVLYHAMKEKKEIENG